MGRRRKVVLNKDPFIRQDHLKVSASVTIVEGEIFKVQGEWGGKFKFHSLVTNPKTGVQWVDCFEMQKGVACAWRSFYPDRVKHIPKKRGKRGRPPKQVS